MRFTLHWRGQPLVALDLAAQSPEDHQVGPTLEATAGGQFELGERMEPDLPVFGIGQRPESLR